MSDYFDGGFGPANYCYLKKIYQLESQSIEEHDKYIKKLSKKNSLAYTQFLEFKKDLEFRIVNIKEVLLYDDDPVINPVLFSDK